MKLSCTLSLALLPGIAFLPFAHADQPSSPPQLVAKYLFDAPDTLGPWVQDRGKDDPANLLTLDTTDPHSGNSALKFTVQNTWPRPRTVYTGLSLGPAPEGPKANRKLRLRFYSRTLNVEAGSLQTSLLERNQTAVIGWAQGKAAFDSRSGATWQENTLEVPLHADTRVITLFFGLKNPVAGQAFWVDDVSAELLETAAP